MERSCGFRDLRSNAIANGGRYRSRTHTAAKVSAIRRGYWEG